MQLRPLYVYIYVCKCAIQISLQDRVTEIITQVSTSISIQSLKHTLLIFHVKQIDFKTASDSDE